MWHAYKTLEQSEITQIHEASLQILGKIGMEIDHPLALEKLAEAGARIDKKDKRAYFNSELIEKSLKTVPKSFSIAGRDPQFDLKVSQQNQSPFLKMCGGPILMFDAAANRERKMTIQDNIDAIKLVNALDHIDIASTMTPQDLPNATYDIHAVRAALTYSRKHFWALTSDSKNLKYQLKMLEIVAGNRENLKARPLASGIFCIISPLKIHSDEIERLLLYGQYHIPIRVPLSPMVGANAPFTLAGTITQTNAEFLGGLVVQQTLCPGIPSWYYGFYQVMDMSRGSSIYGCPEVLLLYAAQSQLAQFYDIPGSMPCPMLSSCQPQQMVTQLGLSKMFASMIKNTEIGGIGGLQGGTHYSHEALVLADEIGAFNKRIHEGLDINEQTLAVQAIVEDGQKGQYLSSPHTMKYLRKENRFSPRLFDWRNFEASVQDSKSLMERAQDRAQHLIKTYNPIPLDEYIQKELDTIVQTADQELGSNSNQV